MVPHRSANAVVEGAVGHGRFTHWAGISYICVIGMSHALLSFPIIVLVFWSAFSVFCCLFTMVSLLSTMSSLFDLIIHTSSERHLAVNNFFSPTLQK